MVERAHSDLCPECAHYRARLGDRDYQLRQAQLEAADGRRAMEDCKLIVQHLDRAAVPTHSDEGWPFTLPGRVAQLVGLALYGWERPC